MLNIQTWRWSLAKGAGARPGWQSQRGARSYKGSCIAPLHPPAAPARSYKGGALHPDFDSPATPPPPSPEPPKSRGVALVCSLLLSLQHPALSPSFHPSVA